MTTAAPAKALRRIVVMNRNESLEKGWRSRSFGAAGLLAERALVVKGVQLESAVYPIPIFGRKGYDAPLATAHLEYGGKQAVGSSSDSAYAMVAHFDDQEAIDRLRREKPETVIGVYCDLAIEAAPAYCNTGADGTFQDVIKVLGTGKQGGLDGSGVRLAIMDTGIGGSHIDSKATKLEKRIIYGYKTSVKGYKGGTSPIDHGTMVAFDTSLAAPQADLLDYAVVPTQGEPWQAFLSDMLAAYADLIELMKKKPGPMVVNNSWALFDRRADAPVGSPQNYSANPDHPFNQIVRTLVQAGADVLFAAGNCGKDCPDGRCGQKDIGPGASIHGANSHASVITVAAVTVQGVRLGYSSQGPGGLVDRKPDIAAYSHFKGSGVYAADGGTSAASPVAAGLVAALRQKLPQISPGAMKSLLQRTATPSGGAWTYDLGYGIVNFEKALEAAKTLRKPAAARATTKAVKATAAKKKLRKPAAKKPAGPWMQERNSAENLAAQIAFIQKTNSGKKR
jgi:subtilisin family serine protease